MAGDPSNERVLYAGTWGSGVYKSGDGGASWQAVNHGLANLYINSLAIDPTQPSTIYAGTYRDQLYKSTDGGISWTWSGAGMQEQAIVYAIAIDPFVTSTVYAGTRGISNNGNPPWNGVVYKSIDAGLTWAAVLEDIGGPEAQDWVYSLAVNPNQEHDVFAATHEHGPYHSYDYGNTWHPIVDGINDYSGRSIVVSPERDSTTLYYGVWHTDTIYKSYNGGNDWFPSNREIQFTKVNDIALAPSNSDTIYMATFTHGVLKSTDGGVF